MNEVLRSGESRINHRIYNQNHRVRTRIFLFALLALATFVAGGFLWSRAGAQTGKPRFDQDLEQVFMNHEDVRLDSHAAAQQVRISGHLTLTTPAHGFEIELRPNDLRAPDYRAEEELDGGIVRDVSTGVVNTYKGSVLGIRSSNARFTVDDDRVEGMIITSDESYFLEPARKYSRLADPADYLLYKPSDVRPEITRTCGDTLNEKIGSEARQFSSSFAAEAAPEAFSPFKVVEIATEADFEYTSALGGSANANNDILSIMNQVQGIYERDIGLTFSVVFQHTWATSNEPYKTSGDAAAALNEFTNYWNANFSNVNRDVAHLWTGRSLGGPVGIAWEGVVCSAPANSYGLSDLETISPFRVGIPAHEIGHNFNASHCDGVSGCDNTIMVATQTQSTMLTFCQFSRDEITTYVNGNSSCLSTATAPPVIQLSAGSYSVNEGSPHVDITVTRAGDTSGSASVGFATSDLAGFQNCNVFNGVASSRCDYSPTIGTLQFAAGETSKSFSVAIIDDSYVEGNESFSVSLNNPSGATLGSPSTATVTIIDNDPTTGPNPIDDSSFFIRMQYLDFLNREPDAGGLQFYLNILKGCAPTDTECLKYTRGAVSANFFRSPEFQQKGSFVMYLYMISIGHRPATVTELQNPGPYTLDRPHFSEFMTDLQSISDPNDDKTVESAKKDALTVAWLQRSEVLQNLPDSLTNLQFVQKLETIAGVTLSNESTLIANLNNGSQTRAQVLRAVAESPEVNNKYYKPAFVTMEYFGYLRRDPESCFGSSDPANCGYIFHNNRFLLAADPDFLENTIVRGFIESPEYRQRFGP